MPKSFWEDWLWGPHDPKARSPVGAVSWAVVQSVYWEYLFLSYILFNACVKLTYLRILPEEHSQLLRDVGFYACVIFNLEWCFEFCTYGYNDFFADNWYKADTIVNVMNWGSYVRDIGILGAPWKFFFPNIAFLRMLRFLKPMGRVKMLFPSKVVVKTVAAAMQSMGPVLSLVFFAMFFFGVAGIYMFGKAGILYYRCGVALEPFDALSYYDPSTYKFSLERGMQIENCTIDMDRYREFLELRGKRALGHGAPHPKRQHPASNLSDVIEALASVDSAAESNSAAGSNSSEAAGRRLFAVDDGAVGQQGLEVGVQILDKKTKKYVTKKVTFSIKMNQDECSAKDEEIFVIDGEEMNAAQFILTEEYLGRYGWLGQPIGSAEHRRSRVRDQTRRSEEPSANEEVADAPDVASEGSQTAHAESEGSAGEHGGHGNFVEARCIVAQPPKICGCPAIGDAGSNVCIDARCPHSLCFLTSSPPISKVHGFSNIASASLTIIALFFQKNWSLWMEKCQEVNPAMATGFYLFTVILGSFCLLNLTVATVGQNYTRVKKEAEIKKAAKDAEAAARAKLQAERDEMKKQQESNKDDDDDDDDDDDEIELLFDTSTAYWYWLLGFAGLAFMHRYYFKLYNVDAPPGVAVKMIRGWPGPFKYSMFWFIVRCITLNYFILGWIMDALFMSSLNAYASEAEAERIEEWRQNTRTFFETEIQRLTDDVVQSEQKLRAQVGKFLMFPIDDVNDWPWSNAREFLEADFEQFKEENQEWCKAEGLIQEDGGAAMVANPGDGQSQAGLDDLGEMDDDSDADDEEQQETKQGANASTKPSQSYFAWFADFVVVANAITLAMEGFDDSIQIYLDMVGYFASIFFILEAMVKSYAYGGFAYYIKDGSNAFDFTLVLLPSVGEATTLTTEFLGLGADFIYPMLAVQSLRVFRIGKLTKHLKGLKRLTAKAFGSPEGVVYAMAVTIIFIVFCALFANELYRDSVELAARRNDFQYFFAAIKGMIEFLFGESYYVNLEIGLQEANVIGLFFFVGYFYIANYLVLRMFIALILENFEFDEDQRIALQVLLFQKRQVISNDLIDGKGKAFPIDEQWKRLEKQNLDPDDLAKFQKTWEAVVKDMAAENGKSNKPQNLWDVIIGANEGAIKEQGAPDEASALAQQLEKLNRAIRNAVYDLIEWQYFNFFVAACIIFSVVLLQIDPPEKPILDPNVRGMIDKCLLGFFTTELFAKMYAFGAFKQTLPVRKTLTYPAGMPPFFNWQEEGGWNMIDFVFICISYVDTLGLLKIGNFKTMRIVRVVRPLQKNVDAVKSLLAALLSSCGNIFHVFNLLLLMMLIWGLIGVSLFRGRFHRCNDDAAAGFADCMGTSYGGLPSLPCDFMDPKYPNGTTCENNIGFFLDQPILVPRAWEVPPENFETIVGGCMFLFRILCVDNLRPLFHSLMDIPFKTEIICSDGSSGANGCPPGETQYVVSDQPKMDNKPENILFGIVYLFFANAFISQLVIGVLIDNIRQQKGTALYTQTQREWDSTGKTIKKYLVLPRRATKPEDTVLLKIGNYELKLWGRTKLYEILMSDLYDAIMMGIIVVNTVWMATEHWPAESWYHILKNYVDQSFLVIYLFETAGKIYSFGVIRWTKDDAPYQWGDNRLLKFLGIKDVKSPYFGDPWCAFDFTVVALSVVTTYTEAGAALEPLKLLRVLRVFRLVKKVKTLQIMISTLLGAVPSILAALFFLAIWIFFFSSIGMMFFAHLKVGEVITDKWNFQTITSAMMLLFRISTGDGWFPIIYDASIAPPTCTPSFSVPCDPSCGDYTCSETEPGSGVYMEQVAGDCGNPTVAKVYFIIFWFGCNFMFGPLFVATLIDYFFASQINEDSLFNDEECELYANAWQEFDTENCGNISIENLRPFIERLCDLGSRVGFRVAAERDRYKQVWARIMTDPIYFGDQPLPVPEDEQEMLGLQEINRENILKAFPNNNRSKAIRKFVYDHTKLRMKCEVRFAYCAKVLLIHQTGIKAPITSADLVNRGAALQQFMGFLGMDEVKGRDGAESTRWQALKVHHTMVQRIDENAGHSKKHKKKQAADASQLSKINHAVYFVRLDLKPPPPPKDSIEDPKPKPTGDKREALMTKIDSLQKSFDEISNAAIEDLLYGVIKDGSYQNGIIDLLLDKIIDHTVEQFALRSCESIEKRFSVGSSVKFLKQKRYSFNILQSQQYAPVVSSMPRGWLNSHRKSKPKRLTLSAAIQDEVEDKTGNTLSLLSQLAPARPKRVDSVQRQNLSHRAGPNDTRSSDLKSRVRELSQNQVWRQMFESTRFKEGDEPPPPPTDGHSKVVFSWREQYSSAMESVAQRISVNRPPLPPLSVSSRPSHSDAMDQLKTLGSLIGVWNAPNKDDLRPDPEEADQGPG